ncbi:MAG: hypothetical protein HYV19_03010 [Gemmatimonadetes bacterium]|nr:hypothetical protein [Gemmatimonadota bacterium]
MITFRLLEAAAAFLIAGALGALITARRGRRGAWVSVVAVSGAAILMVASAVRAFRGGGDPEVSALPIRALGAALRIHVDPLSAVFLCLAGPIALLTTLYSVEYMGRFVRDGLTKYYPVLLILFLAIGGTVVTTDLFWFLVFWELMTLTSFVLVIFERESREAHRAGLKYFVWNQGAALGLMGAALVLWRRAGSFDFEAIRVSLATLLDTAPVTGHAVLFLFFFGFATKAGILPMGTWLPDAYTAAPTSVTAAFGGTMTKLGIYGLLRVFLHLLPLGPATTIWGIVIAVAGLTSLFAGTLSALKQDDAKRLMSYHVIGQVGYMFFGVGAGIALMQTDPLLGTLGLVAGLFHLINNSLYKPCLFLGAGAVEYRTGSRSLSALGGGLGGVMAGTMACSLVASLAIAGVPPLNGFTSKWLLYATGILGAESSFLLPVAALVAMFISIVTLASFVKYVAGAFLGAPVVTPAGAPPIRDVPATMLAPQYVLAGACLVVGLAPFAVLRLVHQAIVGLPSMIGAPDFASLLGGSNTTLALARDGITLASWAPVPLTAVLLILGIAAYVGLQRAGGVVTRRVPVWACGEEENPAELRYRADSLYRPFKDVFHGMYPRMPVVRFEFPDFLRRTLDLDHWLYQPLARGTQGAVRGVSRTHVGIPQVYLLWIIIGAVAVILTVLLVTGGAP